jgi:cyclopropane-fatty-acyl-phospholipid synthase
MTTTGGACAFAAPQQPLSAHRVAEAGLGHLSTVLGEHCENLTGTYDAPTSIEMVEADDSGRRRDRFFANCSTLLGEDGRMTLQAITISDQKVDRAKRRDAFNRDLALPVGWWPSVNATVNSLTRAIDPKPVDLEEIGLDYAATLSKWRNSVQERYDGVVELGFDEGFVWLRDTYLSRCRAAFLERRISDVPLILHEPLASATPRG